MSPIADQSVVAPVTTSDWSGAFPPNRPVRRSNVCTSIASIAVSGDPGRHPTRRSRVTSVQPSRSSDVGDPAEVPALIVAAREARPPAVLRRAPERGGAPRRRSAGRVAARQAERHALEPQLGRARARASAVGSSAVGARSTPRGPRAPPTSRTSAAARPGRGSDCTGVPAGDERNPRRARRVLDLERELHLGGDPRAQLVADRAGEQAHRPELGRGAQEALLGDPLRVEGDDVGDERPRVEQRDAPGRRCRARRARSPGSPRAPPASARARARAARRASCSAGCAGGFSHRPASGGRSGSQPQGSLMPPPRRISSTRPCSGLLGSLSARSTSRAAASMRPAATSPAGVRPEAAGSAARDAVVVDVDPGDAGHGHHRRDEVGQRTATGRR